MKQRTTALVIPLQIPLPPPVQNSTFPLNKSLTKTSVVGTGGLALVPAVGDMVRYQRWW
jgi:hypothetical protein